MRGLKKEHFEVLCTKHSDLFLLGWAKKSDYQASPKRLWILKAKFSNLYKTQPEGYSDGEQGGASEIGQLVFKVKLA